MFKSYINKIHYLFFSLCQFPIKGHNFLIKTRKESTVRLTAKLRANMSMLTVLACICFEFFYTVSHLLLDVRQNAPLRTWRPRPLPLWLVCGTSWCPSDPVVLSSLSVYLHTWRTDTEEERKKEVEEEEAAWRIRPTRLTSLFWFQHKPGSRITSSMSEVSSAFQCFTYITVVTDAAHPTSTHKSKTN